MTGRFPALLLLAVLLTAACGSAQPGSESATPETRSYGSGIDLDGTSKPPQAEDPASRPDLDSSGPDPGPEGARPTADTSGSADGRSGPDPTPHPRDDLDVGHNAVFYLRADHPNLVIETDAVNGREPGREALDTLHTRLNSVLDKPGGIRVLAPEGFTSSKSVYDLDDVKRLERQHRQHDSGGDTVTMHFLFLNGRYTDEEVLGIAYQAGSVVIFTDQVRAASTPLVPPEAIMRSVLVHEAGHLLRLVNNGYESPRGHEDPEHPGHTKHRDGVMFWAVESLSVANVLQGGPPDDFHPDSRADLADLKAGRLGEEP